MKNILLFLALSSTVLFSSCEGDPGPPGEPGVNILGQVFERTVNFQFDADNVLQSTIAIPTNVVVFESDAILVYRLLEDPVILPDDSLADAWEQLPNNFFLDNGRIVQYVFNHTFVDVQLIIDGNFDVGTLGPEFKNNQTFRIVVVPAEFADANLTMEQLMGNPNIENIEIQK